MKWDEIVAKWNDYDRMFVDYGLALNQVQLLSSLSEQVLENFPLNIPPDIILPVIAKQHEIVHDVMERRGMAPGFELGDDLMKKLAKVKFDDKMQRLYILYYNVYSLSRHYKNLPDFVFPDFQRIRLSQEIIMVYALTEGFISNSVRIACKLKPEIMKSDKEIKWKELLSYHNWNELMENLVEKFVYAICYGNLKDKIDNINDRFALELSLTADDIESLDEIDIIRNIIVHNDGKTTQRYIDFVGNNKLKIGDDLPLDNEHIEELLDNLTDLNYKVYAKISTKFFGQESKYLVPKPRQRERVR